MANFTIDDTAAQLVYGPGWGVDASNDPALGQYFQSTYHASQTPGSNVNISFAGTAIYMYGSKGPNRGNFTVRYDNNIISLNARADTLQYQQLLFSATLPSTTHSITLTNTGGGQSWLDLDFITVTDTGNTTATNGFSSTIPPPPFSSSVSSSAPTVTVPLQAPPQNSATVPTTLSGTSNATLILAIVFGVLLFFLLVFAFGHLIRGRYRRRKIRPGPSISSLEPRDGPQSTRSAGSAFLSPQSVTASLPPQQIRFNVSPVPHSASGHSYPNSSPSTATPFIEPGSDVEMRQWRADSTPTQPARPWSPFSTPLKNLFGAAKEGADSMKSTFLKV